MIITVVGDHRASLPPERATVALRLAVEAQDPTTAMRGLEQEAARLTAELDALRAESPSPVTSSAVQAPGTRSWRPWTESGAPEAQLRHEASVRASVEFQDVAALARWASRWGERTGWEIQDVAWTLTDEVRAELEATALAGATADARRRAEAIASAAGAGPVSVVEVADAGLLPHTTVADGPGVVAARAFGAPNEEGVTVSPEDVEVSVRLHARFEA